MSDGASAEVPAVEGRKRLSYRGKVFSNSWWESRSRILLEPSIHVEKLFDTENKWWLRRHLTRKVDRICMVVVAGTDVIYLED